MYELYYTYLISFTNKRLLILELFNNCNKYNIKPNTLADLNPEPLDPQSNALPQYYWAIMTLDYIRA